MTTARGIISSSLRKIGAITKNESPSSDEATDALQTLNDLVASWANDSTKVFAQTLENFTLTANDGEYTIGSGANFNTTRPIKIIKAYIRSGTTDHPVEIISNENFARISVKSTQGIPEYLNYDSAYANGNIKLYPVPSQNYTLYILSEKQITSFASLSTDVTLPPGWERALIYNLAIELAPEYGQPVSAEIAEIAYQSLSLLKMSILRNKSMDVPQYVLNRNIYTGFW